MSKFIEIPFYVTDGILVSRQERIRHISRLMCRDGYILGWSCYGTSVTIPPQFKIVNIDWRNEIAVIVLLDETLDTNDSIISFTHQIEVTKLHGCTLGACTHAYIQKAE